MPVPKSTLDEMLSANDGVGKWLSAALDDPAVCPAMKSDIETWMDADATLRAEIEACHD